MQLQCTMQEGHLWFSNPEEALEMELAILK
jgi:uncharacterized protein YaeQ